MNRKNLAEKLQYIPIAQFYSLWSFTKRNSCFETIAIGMVAGGGTLLFGRILPFIPDSVKPFYTSLAFYIIVLGMVITAKHLQARRDSKRKSHQ